MFMFVILLTVDQRKQMIRIRRYVPGTSPAVQGTVADDILLITFTLSPPRIKGAPLVLEFAPVFCRQPASPNETNTVLTEQEPVEWAGVVIL